jgi:hypothetical protein
LFWSLVRCYMFMYVTKYWSLMFKLHVLMLLCF